jgi:hypothetical protein
MESIFYSLSPHLILTHSMVYLSPSLIADPEDELLNFSIVITTEEQNYIPNSNGSPPPQSFSLNINDVINYGLSSTNVQNLSKTSKVCTFFDFS